MLKRLIIQIDNIWIIYDNTALTHELCSYHPEQSGLGKWGPVSSYFGPCFQLRNNQRNPISVPNQSNQMLHSCWACLHASNLQSEQIYSYFFHDKAFPLPCLPWSLCRQKSRRWTHLPQQALNKWPLCVPIWVVFIHSHMLEFRMLECSLPQLPEAWDL